MIRIFARLLRRNPGRGIPVAVHHDADESYGEELEGVRGMRDCDELSTDVEQWLYLQLDLNAVEEQLRTGLGAVLAAAMDALHVNEADLAASYGWAGVRELAEVA